MKQEVWEKAFPNANLTIEEKIFLYHKYEEEMKDYYKFMNGNKYEYEIDRKIFDKYENDLKQGTKVRYKPSPFINLTGKICGISNTGVVLLGKCYIIELDEESKLKVPKYPYSNVVGFELYLEKI